MFGKRTKELPGELKIFGPVDLSRSQEFLRMWSGKDGPATCFINPAALGADPFLLGLAVVDIIGHGAKAYAQAVGITEQEAKARIWEGLNAERSHSTSPTVQLGGGTVG
jgi:hypothetical protein